MASLDMPLRRMRPVRDASMLLRAPIGIFFSYAEVESPFYSLSPDKLEVGHGQGMRGVPFQPFLGEGLLPGPKVGNRPRVPGSSWLVGLAGQDPGQVEVCQLSLFTDKLLFFCHISKNSLASSR